MAGLIATLLDKGHAYRTDDGSIFFRISSWPGYGKLASSIRKGPALVSESRRTTTVRTMFATSLFGRGRATRASWSTEIGEGRPGWHIECSAMSMKLSRKSFDIHTGGVDLIFPTTKRDRAVGSGDRQPLVRIWLHNAHLQLSGQKMARRIGNIARPADVYAEGYSAAALRYALIATHYRAPMEYGDDTLDQSTAALERLSTAVASLDAYTEEREDDPTLDEALDVAPTASRRRWTPISTCPAGWGAV